MKKFIIISAIVIIFVTVIICLNYPRKITVEYMDCFTTKSDGWYNQTEDIWWTQLKYADDFEDGLGDSFGNEATEGMENLDFDFDKSYYLISWGRPLKRLEYRNIDIISNFINKIIPPLPDYEYNLFTTPIFGGGDKREDMLYVYKMNKVPLMDYSFTTIGNIFTGVATASPNIIVEIDD